MDFQPKKDESAERSSRKATERYPCRTELNPRFILSLWLFIHGIHPVKYFRWRLEIGEVIMGFCEFRPLFLSVGSS